MSIFETLVKV